MLGLCMPSQLPTPTVLNGLSFNSGSFLLVFFSFFLPHFWLGFFNI